MRWSSRLALLESTTPHLATLLQQPVPRVQQRSRQRSGAARMRARSWARASSSSADRSWVSVFETCFVLLQVPCIEIDQNLLVISWNAEKRFSVVIIFIYYFFLIFV